MCRNGKKLTGAALAASHKAAQKRARAQAKAEKNAILANEMPKVNEIDNQPVKTELDKIARLSQQNASDHASHPIEGIHQSCTSRLSYLTLHLLRQNQQKWIWYAVQLKACSNQHSLLKISWYVLKFLTDSSGTSAVFVAV